MPSRQPFARGRDGGATSPASTSGSGSTSTASASGAPTRSPTTRAAPTGSSRSPPRPSRTARSAVPRRRRPHPGTLVHLDQATGDFTPRGLRPPGPLRHRRLGHHPGPRNAPQPPRRPPGRHPRPHLPVGKHRALRHRTPVGMPRARPSAPGIPPRGAPRRHRRLHRPGPRPRRPRARLARARGLVCGPTGLLDSAESLWETAELTHQLHVERFRPTIIEGGEGGEITFLRTDVSVDADGTTPILDAGEEAGVPCRAAVGWASVSAAS